MTDPNGPLLTALTMFVVCSAMRSSWLAAAAAVGWASFAISGVNALLEAVAFGLLAPGEAAVALAWNAVQSAGLALVAAGAARTWSSARDSAAKGADLSGWRWKLPAIAAGYVAVYMTAGALAYPHVDDFYADRAIPPFEVLIPLQVLRAGVFVLAVLPILRTGPRRPEVLTGFVFAMMGGAAPLASDNPFMPDDVRAVHVIEVTVSNFVFGLLTGRLLGGAPARGASADRPALQAGT